MNVFLIVEMCWGVFGTETKLDRFTDSFKVISNQQLDHCVMV